MVRTQMNFKRLSLTDITIDIKRVPKKKTLVAAMDAADVKNKWENSSWGRKRIVQKRRVDPDEDLDARNWNVDKSKKMLEETGN
ncbi:60S ribosomal protein L14-2-like [Camellia sinensis]|uniref:60S ribosomal protein L14-2-like n=1 Tax=Camellia sinensis TaxID=4442 RepID=UPI0010358559|nr:60S ribosomal protein L14-2-like [Camellia sinensis]